MASDLQVVPRTNCTSATVTDTADPTLQIDVSQGEPIVVKCDDLEVNDLSVS